MAPRKKLVPPKIQVEPDPADRYVTMTNALTRAGQSLNLAEKRLISLAASKLDSKGALPIDNILITRIRADEYAEMFDLDPTTAYEQLKDAERTLTERWIWFYDPAFVRKGRPLVRTKFRWVGEVHYHDKEGWVELYWWHRIIPHLVALKDNFSTYQLRQATALRSVYSWRLFELLNRFKSTGWAEYTVEDFLVSMEAPPSLQKDFGQVKRRIIEPAVKELASKDGFLIEVTEKKAGRKVAALRFDFRYDPQGELFQGAGPQP